MTENTKVFEEDLLSDETLEEKPAQDNNNIVIYDEHISIVDGLDDIHLAEIGADDNELVFNYSSSFSDFIFEFFDFSSSPIIVQTLYSYARNEYNRADLAATKITYVNTSSVNLVRASMSIETDKEVAPVKPTFQASEPEPSYAALNALTYVGTVGNDVVTGNNLSINVMDGLTGDDDLTGGQLSDQIWGGDGNDTISGGDGNDTLIGAADNDYILGGNGDDLIWGGDGWDDAAGGNGDDFLSGNEGNDILYGNTGSDIIYGGDGDDTLYSLDSGTSKSDLSYANMIYGGDGNDTIYGSSGTDSLNGGSGNDVIISRSGNGDTYEDYMLALNPLVYYRLGEDSGGTAIDATGNQNATYANGIKHEQNPLNSSLKNKSVKFDGSNDQVVTAADDARFDTTEGTVSAWFNADNLNSNYSIFSKDGNGNVDGQFYVGVNSNGDIYGRVQQGGADSSFTYNPTPAIGGKIQAGQWYMLTMTYGAGGADFYLNNQLIGSNGLLTKTDSDRAFIIGGRNSSSTPTDEFEGLIDEVAWLPNELNAAAVANLYTAGVGATLDVQNTTTLLGEAGNDTLTGSDGIDRLNGGDGLDTLYGGSDADTFIFEAANAFNDIDVVQDFDEGEGDVLDISDILSGFGVNAGNISDYVDINISGDDTYYDYIMALNPLVYFRLDETSGTTAVDSTGNIDGTYLGTPQLGQAGFDNGISNGAVAFDGSNDEIVEISDSSLFNTTEGTVSAWFNLADTNSNYVVFAKDGNGSIDGQFYLGVDSSGDIYGRFQHSGVNDSVTYDPTAAIGSKVQAGQWYMITMSYGAGGADVYINGQLIGSSATLTGTNSDRSFLIGAKNSSSSPDTELNGSIDEVIWLGNELNATEINNLYNAGVSAVDNLGPTNGLYVDTTGSGTFNAANQIAGFTDLTNISDELTMFNNGNLIF